MYGKFRGFESFTTCVSQFYIKVLKMRNIYVISDYFVINFEGRFGDFCHLKAYFGCRHIKSLSSAWPRWLRGPKLAG